MKVDKATMVGSIESRVPYLDHELIEYVYGLPPSFKLAGKFFNPKKSNEKRILRDVAAKYLPQNVAFRKKKGFLLPMNDLLRSNVENVKSRVLSGGSVSKQLLGEKFVSDLFVESPGALSKMQKEYFMWRLFLLESWLRQYNIK
jgi:asparagine synthase (glutamine-hydrolysing)